MPSGIENQLLACEQEALAHSGQIQSHGALLFMDRHSGCFSHVSANAETLLGAPPSILLGQDGRDWLSQNISTGVDLPTIAGKRISLLNALDTVAGSLDVLISASRQGWLLEFEPAGSASESPDLPDLTLQPGSAMDAAELQRLEQCLVDAIQALTGYSRVMLYRFHPDWSGEVLAEAVQGVQGRYWGLRFPASDIPAIARALYAQTPYRHIPDVGTLPVALVADLELPDQPHPDLTWSDLRSVSPVHIQYLQNMQVAASFSISVMLEGKLWGLIACHHHQPAFIPLAIRQRGAQLAASFGATLQTLQIGQRRRMHQAIAACIAPIKTRMAAGAALPEALVSEQAALLDLFGAYSGVLAIGDRLTPVGHAVDEALLTALHAWCQRHQSETVLAIDHLPVELAALNQASPHPICGLLAVGLRVPRLDNAWAHFYWLRQEEAGEIAWAGNPEKPMEAKADGFQLSPRHSFEKWVEVRHGYSAPWPEELLFAAQQWREQLAQWL